MIRAELKTRSAHFFDPSRVLVIQHVGQIDDAGLVPQTLYYVEVGPTQTGPADPHYDVGGLVDGRLGDVLDFQELGTAEVGIVFVHPRSPHAHASVVSF
jgi:hypothetical protein